MRRSLFSLVVCGSAAVGVISFAQDELFSRLDANKDGVLTAEEAGEGKKAEFERVLRNGDKNGDGKLSKEEFAAGLKDPAPQNPQPGGFGDAGRGPGPGGGAFNLEEMLKRIDKDGDGKVSKDEAPDRLKDNFDRIDGNSDGFLDGRELARLAGGNQGNPARPGDRPAGDRPPEGRPGTPGAPPEGRPDAGRGEFPPFARLFDANRDGEISSEEIAAAAEALKKLDANQDGKLTGAELIAGVGEVGRPPATGAGRGLDLVAAMMERLKQADANGDGKISKDEAPDRLKERFDTVDGNADGFIDEAEIRKMAEQMRTQFGGGRPDGARPDAPRPDAPREGDRPRAEGDRPREGGDRPRAEGDRPRAGGGDRPRAEGDRPREGGDRPRRPE